MPTTTIPTIHLVQHRKRLEHQVACARWHVHQLNALIDRIDAELVQRALHALREQGIEALVKV